MPRPDKDRQYLTRLQDYYARHRGLPSYAKLGAVLGLAAKSAVKKVLERLARYGYLTRTPDDVWTPAGRFFERGLARSPVPAGKPLSADAVADPFQIDHYLVTRPSATALIPVAGDSMIDAGIHDGDIVVVRKTPSADPGDIVVAVVDGEYTVKTLAKQNGHPVLLPANSAHAPIHPSGTLEIFGVVTGLIRKYRS